MKNIINRFLEFFIKRKYNRVARFDTESLAYPIRAIIPENSPRISKTWDCYAYLDQGREGSCHISGTEVLTYRGWKNFEDISEGELLATITPDHHMLEYQPCLKKHEYLYDDDVVSVKGRTNHFSVTKDHRMYISQYGDKEFKKTYKFVEARDLPSYSALLVAPKSYVGTEISPIKMQYHNSDLIISGDVLAEFMGIFLSEGCLYDQKDGERRIEIGCVKEQNRERVYNIVNALGFKVGICKDRYKIWSRDLYFFLKDSYQSGALTKKIPEWILHGTEKQRRLFIDAFLLGDGHTTNKGKRFYYSASKDLADGIQQILLSLGVKSSISTRQPRDSVIGGRLISAKNCHTQYVVNEWKKTTVSIDRKKQIILEPYRGVVYCATVQNGILITRLHGKTLISGNCTGHAVAHELAAKPMEILNITHELAVEIYNRAKQLDPWDGENYEGSTVLAAVKAAQERGWYDEYRWAFGEDDLAMAVCYCGPAILGVNWYHGMTNPDRNGVIKPTGTLVGGHAICCIGYDATRNMYILRNSWGKRWGDGGNCYISSEDMKMLLKQGGEACIPIVRRNS